MTNLELKLEARIKPYGKTKAYTEIIRELKLNKTDKNKLKHEKQFSKEYHPSTGQPIHPTGDLPYRETNKRYGHKCNLCDNGREYTSSKDAKQNKKKLKDLRWNCYDISDEIINVLVAKHNDYGPNNIAKAPGGAINGLAVRLHDKIERLNHLISNGKEPTNESIRDTFIDIANYGIIGLLVLDNKWNN